MRNSLVQGLLALLFSAGAGRFYAQSIPYENVTIADGLSQGMIFHAIQSRDGFLWFGTKDGLNRYDGYNFKVYTNDPFDPFSISGNVIRHIYEDERENLWIAIENGDLNFFDRKADKFYRLPIGPGGLPAAPLTCIVTMPDSSLWVGTAHGVCRLHWNPGLTGPVPGNPDLRVALTIETLYLDKEQGRIANSPDYYTCGILALDGTLWLGSANGLYVMEKGSSSLRPRPMQIKNLSNPLFINGLCNSLDGGVQVVFTPRPDVGKFQLASYKNGEWNLFPQSEHDRFGGPTAPFYDEAAFQKAVHDKDVVQIQKFLYCGTPGHTHGTPLFDMSGNIWVGTNGYGLHKFKPAASLFRHFLKGESVNSIAATNSGKILLNHVANPKLISCIDRITGQKVSLPPSIAASTGYSLEIKAGKGWHNKDGMLIRVDPDGNLHKYPFGLDELNLIAADNSGNIWAAGGSKLYCFDPITGKPAVYDLSGMLGEVSAFFALLHDKQGHIWITNSYGLVEGVPDGKGGYTFKVWRNDPANAHSLGYNATLSLCEDPASPGTCLWVGTKGGGLNRLDKASGQFFQLNTRNSDLPNDVIYGILPDEAGNLWVSTNRGLSRITLPQNSNSHPEPRDFYFQNFRAADGLQDDEFNTGSYFRCYDNQLLFGGVNGLTAFYPAQLPERNNDAPVHITDLKINNLPYNFQVTGGNPEFHYDQNILTIEFALLDFTNPKENRYRYRLLGADPDWVEAGTRHFANYTRLRPGTYQFEVEGSTGGGVWSPRAAILNFTIHPPWYASWWAYTLYALLLCGSGYYFYSFQLKRKLESAENERLKELDTVKTRLYTNITHEFRTPLTVILGLAAEIGREGSAHIQDMAHMVQRNGQDLLRLINQILDLAKLDSGAMRLRPVRADIVAFSRYLSESFHSFAAAKHIQLHFLTEMPVFEMDFDKEKLQDILHNLLGNAMKFTPEGGHVYLQISHTEHWKSLARQGWHETIKPAKNLEQEWIMLRVSDTGPGIPESDFVKIFDRFAQSSASANVGGTGIGLALVRELVELMHGSLALRNLPGKGAEFMVGLPVLRQAEPADSLPQNNPALDMEMPEHVAPLSVVHAADSDLPTLLLVEDNADVAEYIQGCLTNTYQIAYARNGEEGIAMAIEQTPDLIISDVMMPLKDGYELTGVLKNDERSSHIPIVLLTARATTDDRIAGLKRGADAYLTKPFHREELLVTLNQLLENRRRVQAFFSRRIFNDPALTADPLPPEADMEDAFLQKLRGVVEANLCDADFEMPQLERALAMSRSQIFRKVKALTGKSPSLFIRSIRLANARKLLRTTTLTISEVAYDTGFSSPQYFSDSFFEEFGERPSATRN